MSIPRLYLVYKRHAALVEKIMIKKEGVLWKGTLLVQSSSHALFPLLLLLRGGLLHPIDNNGASVLCTLRNLYPSVPYEGASICVWGFIHVWAVDLNVHLVLLPLLHLLLASHYCPEKSSIIILKLPIRLTLLFGCHIGFMQIVSNR